VTGQKILYAVVGLLLGAAAGFVFANAANRKEIDSLREQLARAKSGSQGTANNSGSRGRQQQPASDSSSPAMPSEQEIRDLVAKADARAEDADYQRQVGQGVYMYSLAQNAPALMPEAIRLLKRAEKADPKNLQTVRLLGNAHFALAQNGDVKKYEDARAYFLRAVEIKPDDADLHAVLGLTYYLGSPSDPRRAIAEYRKALAQDPRDELALQNIASALISSGETQEAGQRIRELEQVNSNNNALAGLRAQLAQAQNAKGGK
jgi:tetratricopeptide (TPR) repeat protein